MKLKIKLLVIITLAISLTNCGNIINDYLDGDQDVLNDPSTDTQYSISGTVKIDDTSLDGVQIILSGDEMDDSITAVTDSQGSFKFSHLTSKKDYWIYPYKEGYRFTPFRWMNKISDPNPVKLTFSASVEDKDVLSYKKEEIDEDGETVETLKTYEINNIFQLAYLIGFKTLDGNLEIHDATLKTTEGLRNLEMITGDLRIYAHFNLKNLEGFNNVDTIDGDLEIYSAKLKNLNSLESLRHVGGNINLTVNPNSISIEDARQFKLQLENFQGQFTYFESVKLED